MFLMTLPMSIVIIPTTSALEGTKTRSLVASHSSLARTVYLYNTLWVRPVYDWFPLVLNMFIFNFTELVTVIALVTLVSENHLKATVIAAASFLLLKVMDL